MPSGHWPMPMRSNSDAAPPKNAVTRTTRKGQRPGSTATDEIRLPAMRPEKHSLSLKGHRTSVSLEPEFWHAFRALAAAEKKAINQLAAEIDAARGMDRGLASAIRVYVLHRLQDQVSSAAAKAP